MVRRISTRRPSLAGNRLKPRNICNTGPPPVAETETWPKECTLLDDKGCGTCAVTHVCRVHHVGAVRSAESIKEPFMNKLLAVCIAAFLPACVSFEQPAAFAPDAYPGATSFDKTLNQVNIEANQARPCPLNTCQSGLPSRAELARADFIDCKGYVMRKVYALQDRGVGEERLKVATFELMDKTHAVLVVDNRYVLDNLDGSIRDYAEYARFSPALHELPARLVARPAPQTAADAGGK